MFFPGVSATTCCVHVCLLTYTCVCLRVPLPVHMHTRMYGRLFAAAKAMGHI